MGIAFLSFNPFGKILAVFFLIVAMISTSCASNVNVHPEHINIQSVVEPGDTVKMVTKDNREIEFIVVEVSDEAIIGETEKVLFTDISKLEEMSVSAGENVLVITIKTLDAAASGAAGGMSGASFP